MEHIAHHVPGPPRPALAQRPEDRRVLSRHAAHGFAVGEEQVSHDPGVRRPARRTHHPAGPRRPGVLPQHQDPGAETMTSDDGVDRREFLKTASATGLGFVMTSNAPGLLRSRSPGDHVSVAVFGLNGRGMVHAQNFSRLKNSSVAYLVDVDSNVLAKAGGEMGSV